MQQQQTFVVSLVMWAVIMGIFYFFFIRPQKKRDKQLKLMREELAVGDEVVTIGGMIARVAKVEEECVVLELGPNRTKVPFEKWAIGTVKEKKETIE